MRNNLQYVGNCIDDLKLAVDKMELLKLFLLLIMHF